MMTAIGEHHKQLTGTGAGTICRPKHAVTDFTESGRKVVHSALIPICYSVYGTDDGFSVSVAVEVKFDVSMVAEGHHAYLRLVRPDIESPDDVGQSLAHIAKFRALRRVDGVIDSQDDVGSCITPERSGAVCYFQQTQTTLFIYLKLLL